MLALTLGKLLDLKQEWGVSMQALMERAHALGAVSTQEHQAFYQRLSHRGWRKQEPGSDTLLPETPRLAASVGKALADAGLADAEIREIVGVAPGRPSLFIPEPRGLHLVA